MKNIITLVCLMITVMVPSGCTYKSSSGEYSIGGGGLVFTDGAELTIKVEGDSRLTEISNFILKKEDEQEYLDDPSSNSKEGAIDRKFKECLKSFALPWSVDLTLNADEVLFVQVRPIDFNGKVVVEIWRDGKLQKEYSLNNNMFAFQTSYRL